MKNMLKKFQTIVLLLTLLTPLIVVFSSEHLNYDETNNIVTLHPTGIDDTENLISAFQTVIEGGPGGTVQLVEGEYTISEEIVVVNFDGYFKGAGMDKTVLKNEYTEEWPHRTEEFFPNTPGLFLFYQTDELVHSYHISDMKIVVQGQTTEINSGIGINVFDIVGRVNGDKTDFYETEFNSHVENVFFQGSKLDIWHGGNIFNPCQIGGEFVVTDAWYFKPISGTHIVRNCLFDTAAGPKVNGMNGYLLIENNTIRNTVIGGLLYDPMNVADESQVIVRNNTITNVSWRGMWLVGMDNILFENNVIFNSTGDGLFIMDSQNNSFENNLISNCAQYGISLDTSNNNIFTDNIFEENGIDFFLDGNGGEIVFEGSSMINSLKVSNSTFERAEGLQSNIDQLNIELENLETEIESEQNNIADLENQIEEQTNTYDEASEDITRLESELGEAESEIVDLNSHIDSKYSLSTVAMIAVIVMVISGVIVYLISRRE